MAALAALAVVLLVLAATAVHPASAGGPRYAPPVDAPVRDPFRPPPAPWLPGNRGIEYATVPGTLVHAIGPGVVLVAGPVAGRLVLTIGHPDGLRSSYVGLAALRCQVGDRVAGGAVVAVAGPALHVGVRRGDTYLDPASLWGRPVGRGQVVLVPLDGGRPTPGPIAGPISGPISGPTPGPTPGPTSGPISGPISGPNPRPTRGRARGAAESGGTAPRGAPRRTPRAGQPTPPRAARRAIGRSVAATGDLAARVVADLLALGADRPGR